MCLFTPPKAKEVQAPTRLETISKEDPTAMTSAIEKKRKGYSSTIATSGSGLVDSAMIKKVALGS
mgnify:CR=1 FL=1